MRFRDDFELQHRVHAILPHTVNVTASPLAPETICCKTLAAVSSAEIQILIFFPHPKPRPVLIFIVYNDLKVTTRQRATLVAHTSYVLCEVYVWECCLFDCMAP